MRLTKFIRTEVLMAGLLCLTLLYTSLALVRGSSQDQTMMQDNSTYQDIIRNLNRGDFLQAETLAATLLAKYPDNYVVNWFYAASLSNTRRYAEASQYFEAARTIRPFLVTNPQFLIQYGQTLYYEGDFSGALKYLERAQQISPSQAKELDPLVTDIKKRLDQ